MPNRSKARRGCVIDLRSVIAGDDFDAKDRAAILDFASFLRHHRRAPRPDGLKSAICDCGVGARLMPDGSIEAVANRDCPCPCHVSGYAVGKAPAAPSGELGMTPHPPQDNPTED